MNATKGERLDFWLCFFLRERSHIVFKTHCQNGISVTEVFNVPCKSHGEFLTGSEESGRVISLSLNVLVFILGMFGVITNALNICLLKKSFSGRQHFRESLVSLSVIELIVSMATIGLTFSTVLIMENIDRSLTTMVIFTICRLTSSSFRTMAVYATILITIERYLLIALPAKYNELYSQQWKSRLALGICLILSVLLNIPWMFKFTIVPNHYHGNTDQYTGSMKNFTTSQELLEFPYLFVRNNLAKNLNKALKETLTAMDFVVPFPILLVINILLYKSIHDWSNKRAALSGRQKRDINASKMVSVVVLVLIFCHSVFLIVTVTSRISNKVYIELFMLQQLSVVISASTNFMVYYWFGPGFQRELLELLKSSFGDRLECINTRHEKLKKDLSLSQYSVKEQE